MLAHLALSRRPLSLPRSRTSLVAFGLIGLLAGRQALAADTLPLGNIDASSTAKVSSGDTSRAGTMTMGLNIEATEAAVPEGALAEGSSGSSTGSGEEKALLRDASRASVFLGTAISDRLELTLGLHGSFEHVKPADRDGVFASAEADEESTGSASGEDEGWRQNVKQTGFAGASLLLKFKLAEWSGLRLAFAPFLESGAGEQATYSLTRSVGPKAGFMGIASYGAAGVADVSLNAGYRYRDPEFVGGIAIRHEQFVKAAVRAYATKDLSFFVAGEGRRLMIAAADEMDIETGKRTYLPEESGEMKAGLTVRVGEMDLSGFGGGRPQHAGGFGFGKLSYGMGLSMALGNYRGDRPRTSFASDIEKDEAEKADQGKKAELVGPPKESNVQPVNDYSEMIGADIDPLEALGTDEAADFKDVDSRAKQYDADAKVESEDARIERELKEIKAAEEMAAVERERLDQIANAKARKNALERSKEDEELMREWMDEAKQDADKVEGIGEDEMQWNGLE